MIAYTASAICVLRLYTAMCCMSSTNVRCVCVCNNTRPPRLSVRLRRNRTKALHIPFSGVAGGPTYS